MIEEAKRPGLSERYQRAINSKDLRLRDRTEGDADMLAAAGLSDSLGVMLMRLVSEYDQVAADVRRTGTDDLTGMVLILMHLKSLNTVKEALGSFALQLATRQAFMLTDRAVLDLTGRVLTAWLDPNCHKCGGTGKIGGYDGRIQATCRSCAGSGKSRTLLGNDEVQRTFCQRLLYEMDRRVMDTAPRELASNRRYVRRMKEWMQSQTDPTLAQSRGAV